MALVFREMTIDDLPAVFSVRTSTIENAITMEELKEDYGSHPLLDALERASQHRAFGANYIENILYQEMTPHREHPPVRLQQPHLNQIRLDEPSLAEFDTFVIKRRNS